MTRNHVQVYTDQAGEWRWKFVAGNNRIMADSSEGYIEKDGCLSALEEVLGGYVATVPTVVDEGQDDPVAHVLLSVGGAFLPVIFT